MVIVVVCLIGMMAGSCFGIFFSGEDSGTGMTMRDAAREINQEYNEKIEKIKTDHPYDKLILSGSRATWPEILSIYAVKTTSDQSNGQEVASMNDMKLELLRKVFWDMNSISYRVERHTKGSGKDKTTVVYLYITISHKTASEMTDQYHFNADQKKAASRIAGREVSVALEFRTLRYRNRRWRNRDNSAVAAWQCGWSALLELVWLHIACGMVRLLCQLVCK